MALFLELIDVVFSLCRNPAQWPALWANCSTTISDYNSSVWMQQAKPLAKNTGRHSPRAIAGVTTISSIWMNCTSIWIMGIWYLWWGFATAATTMSAIIWGVISKSWRGRTKCSKSCWEEEVCNRALFRNLTPVGFQCWLLRIRKTCVWTEKHRLY